MSVWGLDLLIFYVMTDGAFGEAWTKYSWLQFAGMIVSLGRYALRSSTSVSC